MCPPLKIVGQNDFNGLPQMERDKLVAEWCRLVGMEVSAQVAPKVQNGRPKSGDETAEQSLLAGLNLMAHAAHTLGNYVEQCQNELEQARE